MRKESLSVELWPELVGPFVKHSDSPPFKGKLKTMELAEVNPTLGTPEAAELTVASAVDLFKSALLMD